MPSAIWVGCYAGEELTLRGTLDGCATDTSGTAWHDSCALRNCLPDICERLSDDRRIIVHFDALPATHEGRIGVTGHFDDPGAEQCGTDGDPLSRLDMFACRTHFVVTSHRFAD